MARLLLLAAQRAEPRNDRLTLTDYLEWEGVASPQLSPDGKSVIYSRTWIDKLNDKRMSSIHIMNADGTNKKRVATNAVAYGPAQWSPDAGTRILYTVVGTSARQVAVVNADGTGQKQLIQGDDANGGGVFAALTRRIEAMAVVLDGHPQLAVAAVEHDADHGRAGGVLGHVGQRLLKHAIHRGADFGVQIGQIALAIHVGLDAVLAAPSARIVLDGVGKSELLKRRRPQLPGDPVQRLPHSFQPLLQLL